MPQTPVISGVFFVVPLDNGAVELSSAYQRFRLYPASGEGTSDLVGLLTAFDGRTSLKELGERYGVAFTNAILTQLVERRIVFDAHGLPDGVDKQRAQRLLLAATALGGSESLRTLEACLTRSKVLVSGGATGQVVARLLLAEGVGTVLFKEDGKPTFEHLEGSGSEDRGSESSVHDKTEGAKERRADAKGRLIAVPDVSPYIAQCDFAVIERSYYKSSDVGRRDVDVLYCERKPYLSYVVDGLEAVVGPVVGIGAACYYCLELRRRSHIQHVEADDRFREHRGSHAPRSYPLLRAHAAWVGGMVAARVLQSICGPGLSENEVAVVDLVTGTSVRETVFSIPDCPVCGDRTEH